MIIVINAIILRKVFSVHTPNVIGVFEFLRFQERFRKAPFSSRISVDGRPNRRNKAAFSNFFSVASQSPECSCVALCLRAGEKDL